MNSRSRIPIVLGVALAVAALGGSLLAGASIAASLREVAVRRLGRVNQVVEAPGFVRDALADDLRAQSGFEGPYGLACPIVALEGFVTHEPSGRSSFHVAVYGVDERFWQFQGLPRRALAETDVLLSPALARDLRATRGDAVRIRVAKPSIAPIESLAARRADLARGIRLIVNAVLPEAELGDFSLRPRPGQVRAAFVPLARLARALDRPGQVNTILIGGRTPDAGSLSHLTTSLRQAVRLEDVGLTVRARGRHAIAVRAPSGVIDETLVGAVRRAASALDLHAQPILIYLANAIRVGDRQVPYSFVTATDLAALPVEIHEDRPSTPNRPPSTPSAKRPAATANFEDPPIVLNDWTARQLGARLGDQVWLSYSLWSDAGRLQSEMARFRLVGVVPTDGADRDLVPDHAGITAAPQLSDWDPPFSIDRARFTEADEQYWERYGTAPKAFIPIDVGQRVWQASRDRLSAVVVSDVAAVSEGRLARYAERLRTEVRAGPMPIAPRDARAEVLAAARGRADDDVWLIVLSVAVVIAGLVIAAGAFRLDVDRRSAEIALWQASGAAAGAVRLRLLGDGAVMATWGSLLGSIGAPGYAAGLLRGLRTWGASAAGPPLLTLHLSPALLVGGVLGGWVLAIAALDWSSAQTARDRGAPAGPAAADGVPRLFWPLLVTLSAGVAGLAFLAISVSGVVDLTAGFLGGATLLLVAALAYVAFLLRHHVDRPADERGWRLLARVGLTGAARRPDSSLAVIALIAAAVFAVVSSSALRPDDALTPVERQSSAGGYAIVAESAVPIPYDLETSEGQRTIGLSLPLELPISGARFERFRLEDGDDVSPLAWYQPQHPRILGARPDFLQSGGFVFADAPAELPDEQRNPWLLLDQDLPGGAVPVIADAASMSQTLRIGLGGEIVVHDRAGRPVTLRIVAALAGSVLQGELVMAERHFRRLFPDVEGYRFFLAGIEPRWAPALEARLREQLAGFGFELSSAAERLAAFHRRSEMWLTAFQWLTALGLFAGLLGISVVTQQSAHARRSDLAVLRAVGARRRHIALLIFAEGAWLVLCGFGIGIGASLVGLAPVLAGRAVGLPDPALFLLLGGALAAGLASALAAAVVTARRPAAPILRAE